MGSYLLVFVLAAATTGLFVPVSMRIGARLGALDRSRQPSVPLAGGLAISAGLVLSLGLVGVVFEPTGFTLLGSSRSVGAVAVGAILILFVGIYDDVRVLSAWVKLGAQVVVAIAVWLLGVRIELVSTPFGAADLGQLVGFLITIGWLVGITNAFNLLDGADGVASGSAFFSATAVFIISVSLGHPAIGLVTAALAGALLGFLPFNLPPARVFLGDSGSLLAGFLLAGLAVEGATKGPTLVAISVPLLAFAVPVFDTVTTIGRRLIRGVPVFERDSEHLHHRLQAAGLSPIQVAAVVYGASAVFALAGMLFINPGVRSYAVVLAVIGAGVWLVVRYLRLHEFNELAHLAKRGLQSRKALLMNVRMRRGAERIEQAQSIKQICEGLVDLFEKAEFDEVALVISESREMRGRAKCWRLDGDQFVEGWPDKKPDEWEVVCPFQSDDIYGELRLRRRLGRSAILIDLNLLLELVQPSLGRAVSKIGLQSTASA